MERHKLSVKHSGFVENSQQSCAIDSLFLSKRFKYKNYLFFPCYISKVKLYGESEVDIVGYIEKECDEYSLMELDRQIAIEYGRTNN